MADVYIDWLDVEECGAHFVHESQKLDGLSPLVNVPALRARVAAAVVEVALAQRGADPSQAPPTSGPRRITARYFPAVGGRERLISPPPGVGGRGAESRATAGAAELARAREQFLAVYDGLAKGLVRSLLADLGRSDELASFFLDLQEPPGVSAPQAARLRTLSEPFRGGAVSEPKSQPRSQRYSHLDMERPRGNGGSPAPPAAPRGSTSRGEAATLEARPTLPDFAGAEERRTLLGAVTFVELAASRRADLHTINDWLEKHVVALGCMPHPTLLHEPPAGPIALRPDQRDLRTADARVSTLVASSLSRVTSALKGLIASPCDDRFLQGGIFVGRVRRHGGSWIVRLEPTAPLSAIVLSLFSVSILADRRFYDRHLCVCRTCGRVSFDSASPTRSACHEHPEVARRSG